jgi:hypothetical protein
MPVRNTANEDKNITQFPAPRLIIFIQEREIGQGSLEMKINHG